MTNNNSNSDEDSTSLGERVVLALLGTLVLLYGVYLIADVLNGWGLGWLVLLWIVIAGGLLIGISIVVHLWIYVYRTTGKYQMRNN